jgi:FHA domain
MTDFDGLRCAVTAGDGIVARFPGLVCLSRAADRHAQPRLRELVELCRAVAGGAVGGVAGGAGNAAPGRPLARALAGWLAGLDDTDRLVFGTVAATDGDGLGVFLLGAVNVLLPDLATPISGTDAAAWTDRILPRPEGPVTLTLAGVEPPSDAVAELFDLRAGVVPGVAVVLHNPAVPTVSSPATDAASGADVASDEVASAPAAGHGAAGHGATRAVEPVAAPPEPPPPVPRGPAVPGGARRLEPILGAASAESRPPLPVDRSGSRPPSPDHAAPPAAQPTEQPAGEPRARGHLCSRGHLNDPRSHFCVLCGIRMNERTGVLVVGPRPPLGLLVFDTGATYTVDAGYLIGRVPESDERVRSGALRPLTVDDPSGSVSRVHAEVRLRDWDVLLLDSGSSNGTFLGRPGQDWEQLTPREPVHLVPGTRVRLGEEHQFVFESPSGVR